MGQYLNVYNFNFIINLFNTYPEQLTIEFFIKEQKDYDFLCGTFHALLNPIRVYENATSCKNYLSKNGVKLSVVKREELDTRRHLRGNMIICSNDYPLSLIEEVFKPNLNLHPIIGFLYYDSSFPEEWIKEMERRVND